MLSIQAGGVRAFIEAVVTAAAVLGGFMAYRSGLAAATAMTEQRPPGELAHSINEGIAEGFEWGSPLAAITFMIVLWT
jgi:hypothetical protein